MRAIAGLILSIAAAVLYTIVGIWFATLDPTALLEQIDNFILAIALLPLILLFTYFWIVLVVIGVIVFCLEITGAILIGLGKIKPGGIIVIVASAVGFFVSWIWYFIPLAVGIVGGILALNEK